MKNRQPSPGKEGRVLITPEDGSAPFYAKLSMADEPIDEGTPLVMETLLADATAAALGLTNSATVNDAMAQLNAIKPGIEAGFSAGQLPYIKSKSVLGFLRNPTTDSSVMLQNKTGAPYWNDLGTFRNAIGMREDLLIQKTSLPLASSFEIDMTGLDWNAYRLMRVKFKMYPKEACSRFAMRVNDVYSSFYNYSALIPGENLEVVTSGSYIDMGGFQENYSIFDILFHWEDRTVGASEYWPGWGALMNVFRYDGYDGAFPCIYVCSGQVGSSYGWDKKLNFFDYAGGTKNFDVKDVEVWGVR